MKGREASWGARSHEGGLCLSRQRKCLARAYDPIPGPHRGVHTWEKAVTTDLGVLPGQMMRPSTVNERREGGDRDRAKLGPD